MVSETLIEGQINHRPGFTDQIVSTVLNIAAQWHVQVNFHIEPYPGRTAQSTVENVKYIIDKYGKHPAFYRDSRSRRPLFYIYDSYLTPATEWQSVLSPSATAFRGTPYDSDLIALLVEASHKDWIRQGHFDGAYTYFASDGFTYGSTSTLWQDIASWAQANNLLWIPCVGPGYLDERIRPWNTRNTKSREDGQYYERMWTRALASRPSIVGLTSFNEWHEGTQIEPAVPKRTVSGFTYADYGPLDPGHYMNRTKDFVKLLEAENRD